MVTANIIISGQITIIPKPELLGFGVDSLIKPPFGVTVPGVKKVAMKFAQIILTTCATKKHPVDFPFYWLLNRDPYNGLL